MPHPTPRSPALPSARAVRLALGVWLTLGAALPIASAGQESALLRGVVAEEASGKLVRSATVALVGLDVSLKTGDDGTFEFASVPLGSRLVRVQAEGYPSVVEEIVIAPGTGNVLPVFLQSAVAALDGIIAFGVRGDRDLDDTARTAADLLAQKYPEIKAFVSGTRPNWPARFTLRGSGSITRGGEPLLILDGVRMGGDPGAVIRALRQIPAESVGKLEILKGPSSAFLYGAPDGAIILETASRPGGAKR